MQKDCHDLLKSREELTKLFIGLSIYLIFEAQITQKVMKSIVSSVTPNVEVP